MNLEKLKDALRFGRLTSKIVRRSTNFVDEDAVSGSLETF